MTQAAVATAPDSRFGLTKILQWTGIAILVAVGTHFFWTRALRYTHVSAATYGHYWPYRAWLMMHITGGSLALLLGPFQFVSGLRRWKMTLHRWVGRLYLSGVLLGGLAATYLGVVDTRRAFGVSLIVMAFAWLSTASMAYLAIRRRQVTAHKEWIIRSYVITYGFVVFRAIQEAHILDSFGVQALAMNAWICWVIPLLLAEFALQWRRTIGPARARRPTHS